MILEKRKRHALAQRKWRLKNLTSVSLYGKHWRGERKKWFASIKKNLCCADCGEKDVRCLDFHHVDPKLKTGVVSTMYVKHANKALILNEINKCIVLCANCHRKIHGKLSTYY